MGKTVCSLLDACPQFSHPPNDPPSAQANGLAVGRENPSSFTSYLAADQILESGDMIQPCLNTIKPEAATLIDLEQLNEINIKALERELHVQFNFLTNANEICMLRPMPTLWKLTSLWWGDWRLGPQCGETAFAPLVLMEWCPDTPTMRMEIYMGLQYLSEIHSYSILMPGTFCSGGGPPSGCVANIREGALPVNS